MRSWKRSSIFKNPDFVKISDFAETRVLRPSAIWSVDLKFPSSSQIASSLVSSYKIYKSSSMFIDPTDLDATQSHSGLRPGFRSRTRFGSQAHVTRVHSQEVGVFCAVGCFSLEHKYCFYFFI